LQLHELSIESKLEESLGLVSPNVLEEQKTSGNTILGFEIGKNQESILEKKVTTEFEDDDSELRKWLV
jgi:hypothetical protein